MAGSRSSTKHLKAARRALRVSAMPADVLGDVLAKGNALHLPPLPPLPVMEAVPQHLALVQVIEGRSWPYFNRGDYAVVDLADTAPEDGGIYLVQWPNGSINIWELDLRSKGEGPYLHPLNRPGRWPDDPASVPGGGPGLHLSEGPMHSDYLTEVLRGRVVGRHFPPPPPRRGVQKELSAARVVRQIPIPASIVAGYEDVAAFPIEGDCLDPIVRDGEKLIASPSTWPAQGDLALLCFRDPVCYWVKRVVQFPAMPGERDAPLLIVEQTNPYLRYVIDPRRLAQAGKALGVIDHKGKARPPGEGPYRAPLRAVAGEDRAPRA